MRLLLISLALILLALPAWAVGGDTKPVGWNIRPVFDRDGHFSFCLMDKADPDDKKITIASNPEGEINLGLTIPKAGFALGKRYDLVITLGDGITRRVRGESMDENTILLKLGADPTWSHALAASSHMDVSAGSGGGKSISFILPDMRGSFAHLHSCIVQNKNRVDKTAAAVNQALPQPLQAILVTAGLTNIEPLAMDNIPPDRRPADFAWKIGPILGGVREREVPKGKSVTELASLHLAALKSKCNGNFKSQLNDVENLAGLTLQTSDAECQFPDRTLVVAALYYLSADGKFTFFTHEGLIADKAQVLAARDALARTVRALAKANATR